jgi:threonine/homoserine/homoserine lactone efflux protein
LIENYFLFSLATLSLAVAPGPDNIFVLTQSIAKGSLYGIAIASGLISGCIVHTSVVALGFGAVVRDNEWLFNGIKIAGAAYLVYLAFQVYRSSDNIELNGEKVRLKSYRSFFLRGVTMNLLNPKVTLFFLALLPQFLMENKFPDWQQIYILGGIFMLISLLVFYAIAILAGRVAKFLSKSEWFGPMIKWIQILVFLGIAVALLLP